MQQSNVAFRINLIMLVLIEISPELLRTCSKLVSVRFLPSLVKTLCILLSSSKRESGIASKLRYFSAQLELFVQVLHALKESKLHTTNYAPLVSFLPCASLPSTSMWLPSINSILRQRKRATVIQRSKISNNIF